MGFGSPPRDGGPPHCGRAGRVAPSADALIPPLPARPMTDPSTDQLRDPIVLRDGRTLTVRPIGPGDAERLAGLFARLGDASRHRRFLGPKPRLTTAELAYLTDVDDRRHAAIAAIEPGGAIVAEGRYAAWRGCDDVADLALSVADDLHGHGIGRELGARMVRRARANGFAILTASTLWENVPARALLRRLGFRAVGSDGEVLELELELAAGRRPCPAAAPRAA